MLRIKSFCLFLLVLLASPASSEEAVSKIQGDLHLRAKVLHRLALSTDVDSTALREAEAAYRQLKEQSGDSLALLSLAQAGLDDTVGRLENSDEMFRNEWPLAWWFHGNHEVYEWYDSAQELALDRAWNWLAPTLKFRDVPQSTLLARCEGPDDLCSILTDMVVLSSNGLPHLRAVPRSVVKDWLAGGELGSPGTLPNRESSKKLANRMANRAFLLVDIVVEPDVEWKDQIASVLVQVHRLNPDTYSWLTVGKRRDVGVDVIHRWADDTLFIFGLVCVCLVVATRYPPMSMSSAGFELAASGCWVVLLMGVGGVLGFFAEGFVSTLLPEWDSLAWFPNGQPIWATWVWPAAQAVSMLLIAPLTAFFGMGALEARISNFAILDRVNRLRCVFPLAMGVACCSVLDWPVLFGDEGMLMAAVMVVITASGSVLFAVVVERLLAGNDRLLGGATAVVVCLLSVVSIIALIHGEAVVWSLGMMGLAAATVFGSDLFLSRADTVETLEQESAVLPLDSAVDLSPMPIADLCATHSHKNISVFGIWGSRGSGKSRFARDLASAFDNRVIVISTVESRSGEPYAFMKTLLSKLCTTDDLFRANEQRAQLADLAQMGADGLLGALPGVGFLLGAAGEGVSESMSVERLHWDMEQAVRRALETSPMSVVVDSFEDADAESQEYLKILVRRFLEVPPESCFRLVCIAKPEFATELKVKQIVLREFELPSLSRFVESQGIRLDDEKQAEWLLRRAKTPGDLLELLAHLKRVLSNGQGDEGVFGLPDYSALEALSNAMPTDLVERAQERIGLLKPEFQLTLEMAAQCGYDFDPADVALGMGDSPFETLRALRQIEAEDALVRDVDQDGVFSFESMGVVEALKSRTRQRGQGSQGLLELAKEFHLVLAKALFAKMSDAVNPERVVYHAALAGPRAAAILAEALTCAAEDAAALFAWSRLKTHLESCAVLRLNSEQRHRLNRAEATMLRALGGQENRVQCRNLLLELIHAKTSLLRRDLINYLEVFYEEKEAPELEVLFKKCQAFELDGFEQIFATETVRFYRLLTQWRLAMDQFQRSDPRRDEAFDLFLSELGSLRLELVDSLSEAGTESRFRDLLLARVENEFGNNLTHQKPPVDASVIYQHLEESLRLAQRHDDQAGQATTYGLMGNYAHFNQKEHARALNYWEQSYDLEQAIRKLSNTALTKNKMAGAYFAIGQGLSGQARETEFMRAYLAAYEATQFAQRNEREADFIFAASALVKYAVACRKPLGDIREVCTGLTNAEVLNKSHDACRQAVRELEALSADSMPQEYEDFVATVLTACQATLSA